MNTFTKPAVDITVVPDANEGVGAFVWWSLRGDVRLPALQAAWTADLGLVGVYPLPESPQPSTALRRAAMDMSERRRLSRPLPDDRVGYALVEEEADSQVTLRHHVELEAWLEEGALHFKPDVHALRSEMETAYANYLVSITADDAREWLTGKILPRFSAVKLRNAGAVYFIPPTNIEVFRKIVDSVKKASDYQIFAAPAMRSDDVVSGVLDGIREEAEKHLAYMKKILESGVGPRAIQTQVSKCAEITMKLERYEQLLDSRRPTIHEELAKQKAYLTEALIRMETEQTQ